MPKGRACAAGWDQKVAHLHESDRTSKYRIASEPLYYQSWHCEMPQRLCRTNRVACVAPTHVGLIVRANFEPSLLIDVKTHTCACGVLGTTIWQVVAGMMLR
jgi:hypothetical protein